MSRPAQRTGRRSTPRGALRFAAAVCAVLCLCAPARAAYERPKPPPWIPARYLGTLMRVDSLGQTSRPDAAIALVGPILREARAGGDPRFLALLLRMQGDLNIRAGRPKAAEPALREAIVLARAQRDSAMLARATRFLAITRGQQGDRAGAIALYRELLAIGIARGDRSSEGYARTGLGLAALEAGDLVNARAEYERADALLSAIGDHRGELDALTGTGRVFRALGEYDRARECWRRVITVAHANDLPWNEAHGWNNLGGLEFSLGDPGTAVRDYRKAYELHRSIGSGPDAIIPLINIALAEQHLGQLDDALATLDETLALCRLRGFRGLEASALLNLGNTRAQQGHLRESAGEYRAVRVLGDTASTKDRVEAMLGLARVLVRQDSAAAALAMMDRELVALGRALPADLRPAVDRGRAAVLLALGRTSEALASGLAADRGAERLGLVRVRMPALDVVARCERVLGRPERALAAARQAVAIWEEQRGAPLDPEWRAQRGADGRGLSALLAELMLEDPTLAGPSERVRAAFDAIQRFKARALHERMIGPGDPAGVHMTGTTTLAILQRRSLADHELLLDLFAGTDVSFLFAVTRDSCRVVRLPGEDTLATRLRLYHDLIASPPRAGESGGAIERAAGERLGTLLFGEVADLIQASRRVVFALDGTFNLIPPASLSLPATVGRAAEPLLVSDELVLVPSATALAMLRDRARQPARAGAAFRILALAGTRRPNGDALAGATSEVGHLASRYQAVDARTGLGLDGLSVDDLAHYDVLHLAAHTVVDDQHPWRSGIQLAADTSGEVSCLRASRIAGLRLGAQLAVLSGCESAGGRILSGEGVQGLSAAFLSTGVPTVVATLWPVDDRATATLMDDFYAALQHGASAAAALRDAQSRAMRRPATRQPFYWAGFVLIGDGDVHIPMRPRPIGALPIAIAVGTAIGVAWLAASRRRASGPGRGSSVIPSAGERLIP